MGVLLYLVEHQGEVVKRDDLIGEVWEGTFVTDEALSRAISVLRTQLGDDRMTPTYIQTLPKVGYRLIMPVEALEATPDAESVGNGAKGNYRRWYVLGALAIVLVAFVASWFLVKEDVEPDSPAESRYCPGERP